jgi:CRP-like cAMP-binding protein
MAKPTGNRLLDAISARFSEQILSSSKHVALPVRTQLYWPDEMPQYCHFLTGGIASIVAGLDNGASTEVGLMGNEGVVGAFHIIGPIAPANECFMQVPGSGYRVPLPVLRECFKAEEEIRDRVLELVQVQSLGLSQVAACNKLHESEPRLARWLLMIRDRVDSDTIQITQEFLGQMIGSRRTTVNGILSIMERKGLLHHQRGKITISDRRHFEKAACNCYPLLRRSLDRLYEPDRTPPEASRLSTKPSLHITGSAVRPKCHHN